MNRRLSKVDFSKCKEWGNFGILKLELRDRIFCLISVATTYLFDIGQGFISQDHSILKKIDFSQPQSKC